MTAQILDGKRIAQTLREQLRQQVAEFVAVHGRPPGLDVVLVGDHPPSVVYTRNKEKASNEVGMHGQLHRLSAQTSENELLACLHALNENPLVDGILVQLPLPDQMDERRIVDAIDPAKDVDGLHPMNAGLLLAGRPKLVPCTPRGCMRLLAETGQSLVGAQAVVVGRSNLVGKPVAQLLLAEHATVTIAHSRTQDLASLCRQADVLVVAIGKAERIRGDWIKPGSVVIDVGINRTEEGKLVGDVEYEKAKEVASWISPVPGGVGPLTIAMLLDNTLAAARARVMNRC